MTVRIRTTLIALLAAAALCLPPAANAAEPAVRNGVGEGAPTPRAATTSTSTRQLITFDTGTSPCVFNQTSPLRDRYAGLGVTMRGPTDTTGGAVVDQCGDFGFSARSGAEFLGFNVPASYADVPEHFHFSALQRTVQMFANNGRGLGVSAYTLTGYRAGEIVVRRTFWTTTTRTSTPEWVLLRVYAHAGMDTVTLTATTPDGAFGIDDLKYTALG